MRKSIARALFRLVFKGEGNLEDAATTRLAVNADGPVHEFDKLLTDREPQSRPSVFFRGRSVGLHERLKNSCTGFWCNADPRIGDGEVHSDDVTGLSHDVR